MLILRIIDRVPANTPGVALIQIIEFLHVFLAQLEIIDICVGVYPGWRCTLWKRYEPKITSVSSLFKSVRKEKRTPFGVTNGRGFEQDHDHRTSILFNNS